SRIRAGRRRRAGWLAAPGRHRAGGGARRDHRPGAVGLGTGYAFGTRLRLRNVEEVGDVRGETEVTLGLQLAGHEHHHRVTVARDDLDEVDGADGDRELGVVLRLR